MIKKLVLLCVAFVVGFAVFAFLDYKTVVEIQINGPIYERIVLGKDVIADVLPPPAYIVETNMVVLQLLGEEDPVERAHLRERLGSLEASAETCVLAGASAKRDAA